MQQKNTFKDRQETYNISTAYYIENLFSQYDTILDIIRKNILAGNLKDEHGVGMLDQILSLNPTLGGIALFKPDGTPYLTTNNIDKQKLGNLLKNERTKEDFSLMLKSDRMVIGRTYFVEAVESLVTPIRKAVVDKEGKVVAVEVSCIL